MADELSQGGDGHPIPPSADKSRLMKRFWINPNFQYKVITIMLGVALVVILSTLATVNYFFYDFIQKGHEIGLSDGHVFFEFIQGQQTFMNRLMAVLSVFLFVGIFVVGLILSHRVAGPIYRLNLHMKAVAVGQERGPVVFREKDFFRELADSYNAQYHTLKMNQGAPPQRVPTAKQIP